MVHEGKHPQDEALVVTGVRQVRERLHRDWGGQVAVILVGTPGGRRDCEVR